MTTTNQIMELADAYAKAITGEQKDFDKARAALENKT